MNDTPGRRNPPRFVPPPWEREQFDELAKKKAADQARSASELQVQQEQAEESRKIEEDAERRLQEAAKKGVGDETDNDVARMMAILKAEEPSAGKGLWKAGVASGVFMVCVGAIFLVWGIVAIRATQGAGSAGQLGAGILILFGMGFIAIAIWTIQRSLRQRGAS